MTERKIDHSDQMTTLQLHKSKCAKPVKPHIPVKPNFLKKQQFNKPSNKKLMLIANEDGNVTLLTHKNAPPVAPKPKSTFHVRVQQHGRKLQVCPIGHFFKIQTHCDDKNSKDALKNVSCKIELEEEHNKPSANIPTPAPRNLTTEQPNSVNPNNSSTEVRKNFERIKSNFEVADKHSKPQPSPRSGVNVKIRRVLFENMLRSKNEGLKMEQSVSDNPILFHQNQNLALSQAGGKLPKNIQPLLNFKSSSKSIPQRPTSKPSYKALSSQLNLNPSFRDIPLEPNSKPTPSADVSQPRDISSELSNAGSSEQIPKPLPRHILPKMHSKAHSPALPSKIIPSNLISKSESSDIQSEHKSSPTSSTSNQDAAIFGAKHDIPKITFSDEYTDVSDCEHLADVNVENDDKHFDTKNENNAIKVCTDVNPEMCLDTEPEAHTDVTQGTSTDIKPGTCMDVESESNTNSKAESEMYTYVKPESDSNEIQHFDEQSDKDNEEHEYVNYNSDDEGSHQYVNVGDFCDTISGEYIILENDLQTTANDQSTLSEDTLLSDATEGSYDQTYVNYELPSDVYCNVQIDDSGSKHSVVQVDNDGTDELGNFGDSAMKSGCYEVVLNVSSPKGHASKYRRFSCRQPGRCRRSNFKKQSALKGVDVDEEANNVNEVGIKIDEGSDFTSSQEDLKHFEGHNIFVEKLRSENAETEYTKEHFQDDEEDEGWQSVDSSDFDHDEDTSIKKRSFQHVLSITPEPGESGVSSGNPSPSRLSSATSDSQVMRVNSCLSFVSSDGFEDGSVRSSISQFSLSDELEGINTCDSFEEDEFTDKENELLEIMKRESTLSDGVQDVEDLKNETMEHIKKMRKKLAEMKQNVARKNRQRVSLVSEYDIDLPESSKPSCRPLEVCNNSSTHDLDANQISENNITEPPGSGENIIKHKLKEISWQEDLNHTLNNRRTNLRKVKNSTYSMKSSEDDNRADLQVSLTEESVESIYISAEVDDEAHTSRRSSLCSYVDPDELKTSRKQSSSKMEPRTSWRPGIDGAPPIPPRTPSVKLEDQRPNLSVHKTHSAGAVLQTKTKISKKDLRRQSRFVRKEPLFQAYNKDAKLRDTLHFTGNRKHRLSTGRDSPPPLPPPRRQSSVNTKTSQQIHFTPEHRSHSFPEIDAEEVNRKPSLKMQRTLWCEVPEVVESGILDQIDDRARKLQEAMFEVITSEASYLRSLDIFVNNFMKADVFNVTYGLLRKEERHHLFSNLLSVRDASERLLLDLEDRFQENYLISDVCDIIIKHATQRNFDMYVTYCLNNQYQIKTLKSLKENPVFVTELGILERSKECGGNNLMSFIMMPFQRITRLPLLIEAIIARLEPESAHIMPATEALNLVKKVAIKCNEEARRMEGIEELTKLAHKLDYKPNIKAIKISDKLLIVKRGDLQWFCHDTSRFNKKKVVSKQIHILVFADKVVLTKRKIKNDREVFEVFDWCPRNLVDVKAVELKHDTLLEDYKNVMMVVFLQNHEKKEKKYFINTTSDANFQRWSDALAPPNRSDQGESIYESWDCPQVMCIQGYTAQEPDELSMEESDVVDVLRKSEGWWEGMRVRDNAKGWFPASHVHEIVNDHVRARNLKHRYKVLSVCQEQLEMLQMQGRDILF